MKSVPINAHAMFWWIVSERIDWYRLDLPIGRQTDRGLLNHFPNVTSVVYLSLKQELFEEPRNG